MFERIRRRLTLGYIGILALILVVFGAIVVASFSQRMIAQQDKLLTQKAESEAASLVNGTDRYGSRKATTEYDIAVAAVPPDEFGGGDDPRYSEVNAETRVLDQDASGASLGLPYDSLAGRAASEKKMVASTVEGPGGAVRVVSRPLVSNGEVTAVIQAAQSRTLIRETVLGLAAVLGAVGLGALGLAALGGLYMSRKAIRPAQEAFRLQRDFTADASHELKTPLALVRINAEEIEQDPTSRENREIVGDQLAEIGRMDALLSDLLVLSRLDAGRLEVQRDPFDLSITAVETAERFLRRAADAGARLEVEVPDELPVRGDAGRTDQILAALLDNAIRHTPKGETITVTVRALDGRAEASVANTGSSIPEDHLYQIFERFYRSDPQSEARGRTGGGTGLGLAIARDLARAQGGDLTAENTAQGKAASAVVFRLSLPRER